MNQLELCRYVTRRAMGEGAASRVAALIRAACAARGEARVIFACAPSQDDFLTALIGTGIDWSQLVIFHMDEYVGLPAAHPQSFRSYLRGHLLAHIAAPKALHLIGADAPAPARECARYAALLSEKPIDLVCLGIGENGHLAFNDPPVADFHDPRLIKIVELDAACRQQQVNDGCFPALAAVPARALTLTIPALLDARHISCVVPGERKARAVRDTVRGAVSTACPASILQTHGSAVLHLDAAAGSLLQ